MDFIEKHLKETLETIKTFNISIITVKRIRVARNIKSSNRSAINFIWRALRSLVDIDFLELNGSRSPQSYKLKNPDIEIDIKTIVSRVLKERRQKSVV